MKVLRAWLRRALDLLRRNRHERELAEELDSHLALHIADNLGAGMTAEEARRQAILALGGIEPTKEAYREQRGLPWLETTAQDVRYALRGLRRSPGFAATAVLTLALGIGATTAIFSAVYALLIRPLPYREPERLVWVAERLPMMRGTQTLLEPDMIAWRQRGRPFDEVGGYDPEEYTLTGAGEPLRISAADVTGNLLSILGVRPQVGRNFVADDDHPGSALVTIISDSLWRERFHSDPRVIGTTIGLDGQAYAIVGVLPREFRFPDMAFAPQLLVPFRAPGSPEIAAGAGVLDLRVIGRLGRGESLPAARSELQSVEDARLQVTPSELFERGRRMELVPLQRHLAGDSRTPLLVLLAAVGFVLLIACGNIANLQLVRAAARRHEIAVRGALGAARSRLARQFLTESVVISCLAAIAGLAMGAPAIRAIRGWQSPALPWLDSVSLDPYVFAFCMGTAAIAAILFGAAPAISGSRAHIMDALKATALRMSEAHGHRRVQQAFIVGEVALALVLLIAAGLLVRSFRDVMRTEPGYDPHHLLTAKIDLPLRQFADASGKFYDYKRILSFAAELLPKLKGLPEVRFAALAEELPLEANHSNTIAWTGSTPPPRETWGKLQVAMISVTPEYFRAVGTPILQGRPFTAEDNEDTPGVVIVNHAFVQKILHGDGVGQKFHSFVPEHCAGCAKGQPTELQVVGIAVDVHQRGLDRDVEPVIYVPFAQSPRVNFAIALATNGSPGGVAIALRSAVLRVNGAVPVYDVFSMEQRLSESLAERRLMMFLLSAFAALALLLSAIGVYGVISYAVVQRTQEIGIRMALGATRGGVLRLVVGQQARLIVLGSLGGLALAWAVTGVLSSLLYGVSSHDAVTFAISWVALTLVALLASAAPALRATRTEPCEALRYE